MNPWSRSWNRTQRQNNGGKEKRVNERGRKGERVRMSGEKSGEKEMEKSGEKGGGKERRGSGKKEVKGKAEEKERRG